MFMENKGKVSIIVPVYNAAPYLGRCVESLLNQSYTDFELILVDDGSNDSSALICDKYAVKDERVRVFHQPNAGPSAARNRGLDEAIGKWVCFVDADDYVDVNYVTDLVRGADDTRAVVVQGLIEMNGNGETCKELLLPSHSYIEGDFGKMLETHNLLEHGYVVAKLYPLQLLRDNHIRFNVNIQRAEDLVFFLHALSVTKKVCLLSHSGYRYVTSQSSLSVAPFLFNSELILFSEIYDINEKNSAKWNLSSAYVCMYLSRILMHIVLSMYKNRECFNVRKDIILKIKTKFKPCWILYDTHLLKLKMIHILVLYFPVRVSDFIMSRII